MAAEMAYDVTNLHRSYQNRRQFVRGTIGESVEKSIPGSCVNFLSHLWAEYQRLESTSAWSFDLFPIVLDEIHQPFCLSSPGYYPVVLNRMFHGTHAHHIIGEGWKCMHERLIMSQVILHSLAKQANGGMITRKAYIILLIILSTCRGGNQGPSDEVCVNSSACIDKLCRACKND